MSEDNTNQGLGEMPQPPQPQSQQPQPPQLMQGGQNNNIVMAVLAYLGVLVLVPLLTNAKNDPFVKFHVKQGLVLFIAELVGIFINIIPFLGLIISPLIMLGSLALLIIGIINVAGGKQAELPVLGKFAAKFTF